MILQIVLVVEIFLAVLTVVVSGAVRVMRNETQRGGEVSVAIVTDVVLARVVLVLFKTTLGPEVPVTTIAVCHCVDLRQLTPLRY